MDLSDYQLARERNIRRNAAKLRELGLGVGEATSAKAALSGLSEADLAAAKKRGEAHRKRKRRSSEARAPSRRSLRARKLPAPSYVPPSSFIEDERKDRREQLRVEKKKGSRLANGKWRVSRNEIENRTFIWKGHATRD